MNKLIQQAFTLIELLVVVAIIGIISGLIVVSMSGATQKATIAKAQVFSNSLRNSLMLNLVSEWKFNEVNVPAANQTPDSWSGGNTGTLYGAAGSQNLPQLQTTGCVSGNCLSFDGTDDYVGCVNNDNLDVQQEFTYEAWIYPTVFSGFKTIMIHRNSGASSAIGLWINDSLLYAEIKNDGRTSQLSGSTHTLSLNKWQHVALTLNASGVAKTYLNGDSVSLSGTVYGPFTDFNTPFYIGTHSGSQYFSGSIDDVRVYNAAISTSKIKEQYYTGLNRLLINGEITKEEYLSIINSIAINE